MRPSSLPSRLTDHYSLATRFTSHVPRPTIVGVRRRCRAPSRVQHSPPGRRQHAMKSYVFGFSAEVWRAWFSAQLNIEMKLTSISLETLVGRDSRPNCLLKNELRRYEPRSRFPKNPPFRAHFRAFYPHPAHKSALRAEVAAHYLAPGKRGWSPLATVLPSHAPRSASHAVTSGVRWCADPSPTGYCLRPTAELPRRLRGPITPTGPPLLVCHRIDDSFGKRSRTSHYGGEGGISAERVSEAVESVFLVFLEGSDRRCRTPPL